MKAEHSSRRGRSFADRAICAARSAYYLTERFRIPLIEEPAGRTVSVYIPTHNRVDLLLKRALPSVFAQTHQPYEVIVAAHGCTDGTIPAVKRVFPSVKVLDVPRTRTYPPTAENHWLAGPVVPANAALEEVTGDWIARIDDDDMWRSNHLQRLLRFAQDGGYEFVSSAYRTVRDGQKYIVFPEGRPPIGGTQTWLYRSYLKFMKYNPDCYRKAWNRVNDTDLADRFRKAGVWIGALGEVTAEVLPRPGETTVGLQAYQRDAVNKEREFSF